VTDNTKDTPNFEQFLKQRRLKELKLPPIVAQAETSGSGNVISPDGLVLTAAHVVSKNAPVKILHGKKIYGAKQVLRLEKDDILLLQIKDRRADFDCAEIDGTTEVRVGDKLMNVSYPNPLMLGLNFKFADDLTVTSTQGLAGDKTSLQIKMDSGTGSSGSGLFNTDGRIVAVLEAMLEPNPFVKDVSGDISFAIKISSVLDKLAPRLPPHRRRDQSFSRQELIQKVIRSSVVVFGLSGR